MISIRRAEQRGFASHGWLETFHTFSFADYHNPDYMGFSVLRVINQDRVAPGKGFQTHGHDNMEIVTYVLEGVVEHEDSMGNTSQIRPGEVQLMSAGTGVRHSEVNPSPREHLALLQMWILPSKSNTEPRYEQKAFAEEERRGRLRLVVSPDGRDGSLTIGQDTCLYAGLLSRGEATEQPLAPGRSAWVHVARGTVTLNGEKLGPGDGAGITKLEVLSFEGTDDADVLLFDLP